MTFPLALETVVALVAIAVLLVGALVVRRRLISRAGGTFDCSLRLRPGEYGRGWVMGVARFGDDRIDWYRTFSFAPRPKRTLSRSALHIVGRRRPKGAEALALLSGAVVLECIAQGENLQLAMNEPAATGFRSWLEAAPPGQGVHVA